MSDKIRRQHLERKAVLYIRQSSVGQVTQNQESQRLQYGMRDRLQHLGWSAVEVIDNDLGCSAQRHAATLWACDFFSQKAWTTSGPVTFLSSL